MSLFLQRAGLVVPPAAGGDPFADVVSALSGVTSGDVWDSGFDVYQSSGGSASSVSDPVGSWLGGVNGYEFLQSSPSAKPSLAADGVSYDGVNDRLSTTDWSLTGLTDYTFLIRVKTTDTAAALLSQAAGIGVALGILESGQSSSCVFNAGSPTLTVDGSSFGSTRDDLYTAISDGSFHVFKATGADVSAWTGFATDFNSPLKLAGTVDKMFLFPTSNYTSNQSTIDTWIGL